MRLPVPRRGAPRVWSFLLLIGVLFFFGSWNYPVSSGPRALPAAEPSAEQNDYEKFIVGQVSKAIARFEQSTYRNNPGALEFHGQEGATRHSAGRFAEFETLEQGYEALRHQVERIFGLRPSEAGYRKNMTIKEAVALYANLGEGPRLTNYSTVVAAAAQSGPDSTLESVLHP